MSEVEMKEMYLLDLDRTLLDTDKAAEALRIAVSWHNAALATQLTQRIEDYTLLGESFSMRDFILEQVGEVKTAEIEAKFIELSADQDLLNPGARELIAYIRSKPGAAIGILTFGSTEGQAMKIKAAGIADLPYLVTGETFKGEQISSWRDENGVYNLPEELGGISVATIVFVDDKPFSFKGLAGDCRGYWVHSLYDAGKERIPSYVVPVEKLADIIQLEIARDTAHI